MSWESTVTYYSLLNRLARARLGALHSASVLLYSFDFADIEALQARGDWLEATRLMVETARRLETAGADCLLICTNTMHLMADDVADAVNIPLLHIADVTARAILDSGVTSPLLLATRYTMEEDFYLQRLLSRGVAARIPGEADRSRVHDIIYNELCQGQIRPESRAEYLEIIDRAEADGADGVIFGCTEVGLLISTGDLNVPGFDTTSLHAEAAMEFALT
jgi:aspartate racemase